MSRSVFDRKFRIKAAQSCHSDRYCSGKRPLWSGLENWRARKVAIHDASSPPGSGGPAATHTPRPEEATHQTAWLRQAASGTSVSVCDATYPRPPNRIRTFRFNAALFRSNGVVSAPMRTREVIETNQYLFRPNAERDKCTQPATKPRSQAV